MKIRLSNNQILDINVLHNQNNGLNPSFDKKYRAQSYCIITDYNTKKQLGEGTAKCLMTDQFSKHIGSALSLARALKKLNLTKELRTQLWNIYWNGKYSKKITLEEAQKAKVKAQNAFNNKNLAISVTRIGNNYAVQFNFQNETPTPLPTNIDGVPVKIKQALQN